MKQIYTKGGDGGETSLRGGMRVPKDHPRIEANGEIDQLNGLLGIVRSMIGNEDSRKELLFTVQRELMVVMSHIATPQGESNPKPLHVVELTRQMETFIDSNTAPAAFVIPGDSLLGSYIHLARSQARCAERRLWTLSRKEPIEVGILVFMNRLSDYLFSLALSI
ncbi:MAG: cob(I)yrinic acid a,c-diamide adenosyltransferase [Prevotella sp.]|nr:cob(I)yrinic acid a,c-diamide adenosyltransferase [Prevotella sp.]